MLADLFSTHPPVQKRLDVLLDMAHTDVETLAKELDQSMIRPKAEVPSAGEAIQTQWMVNANAGWQGPYNLSALAQIKEFRPESWIKTIGDDHLKMAHEDQTLKEYFNQEGKLNGIYDCPHCHTLLNKISYEGTEVHKCPFCQGVLATSEEVTRLIIRRDVDFSENIIKIAEAMKKDIANGVNKKIIFDPQSLLACPQCKDPNVKMLRHFYNEVYFIEVDQCFSCKNYWFDKDELEVLQCAIERQTDQKGA